MPVRLTAFPPGRFIRDHLVGAGGMDYVQSIHRAYKAHLESAGVDGASRSAMSTYIWICFHLGLVAFDHAEAVSYWDGEEQAFGPSSGYRRENRPQAPSPRHYYRIVDPADPRWERNLQAVYRESVGLPQKPPRKPPVKVKVKAVPPPPIEVAPVLEEEMPPPPAAAAPAPTPAPARRPRPPRAPAVDIAALEQDYEEVRALARDVAARPTEASVDSLDVRIRDVLAQVELNRRGLRGPVRDILDEIALSLRRAQVEDIRILRHNMALAATEPLPARRRSLERSVAAAARVLVQDLPAPPAG